MSEEEASMEKTIRVVLALLVVLMMNALPADARRGGGYSRHGGVDLSIGIGSGWWGPGWGPGWYGSYPYYPLQPVIIQAPPPIYVQPAPQAEEPEYWYYCQESQGYYPDVERCPTGWMKVVPPEGAPEGAPEAEE